MKEATAISPQFEIVALACVVAVTCALPGCLLLLRRMALMSDAISHAILLGIVLGFFLTGTLDSPLLLVGAALTGVLTVSLTELLVSSRQVREDTAIGLVFPVLFSVAVILINRYAGNVHIDTDAVLIGEIAYAPFNRLVVGGHDLGMQSMWTIGAVLALSLGFILLFYKELKLSTFDPALAAAQGFMPVVLGYALMALVSLTAVASFDAVGSILVVALMIVPPATAYLLTDRLATMLWLSALLGVAAAVSGYLLARQLDASIAGAMAVMSGVLFAVTLVLAPDKGLLSQWLLRRRQRWEFAAHMLAIHLLTHEGTVEESTESAVLHMGEGLHWTPRFSSGVIAHALDTGLIEHTGESLLLTPLGRETAREVVSRS